MLVRRREASSDDGHGGERVNKSWLEWRLERSS